RHHNTPTIGEPTAISSVTAASAIAPTRSAGESLAPLGSRCGLLSATRPGVILTPILTLCPGGTFVWAKVASPSLVNFLVSHPVVLPGGPAKQVASCAPPGTVVVIFKSLINGLPKPGPSQKNSS